MSLRCDMSGRCICKSGFVGRRCEISRQMPKLKENARSSSQQIRVPPRRWGVSSASGCPRGAYRPAIPVIKLCALHGLKSHICLRLELSQIFFVVCYSVQDYQEIHRLRRQAAF